LYFTTKETILVRVDNASKKYGEVLPAFTATYTLESVDDSQPLASAGLTPAELARIYAIDLTTIATAQSNVGLWGISADLNDPLNPSSNVPVTDPLDVAILDQYNILFDDGLLTIDPADLTITPRDTTFVYNDSIVGLRFNYVFSDGGTNTLDMSASDSLVILNAVKTAHGTALVNATGLVRGTALVNNEGDQLLTDSLLSNFSFMISQAVSTTRGTALVNGELIDPAELYYSAAFTNSTGRLVRGTALVNGYPLVRGTALVNELDSLGNITNTSSLTNAASLVNNSGLLNSSTITLNSNSQTLVILGDDDIAILSGDSTGDVIIRSVNLITGNTVGTHLAIPGTYLTNNFNVHYGLGHITIVPDTAQLSIAANTLTQTYNGTPKTVGVSVVPAGLDYTVTYNGSATPPVNAGSYAVQITVNDTNYVGTLNTTLVVQKAPATATTGIYLINKGAALPTFTATYSGFLNGQTASVVTSTTFTLSPNYTGQAGVYQIIVNATAVNYTFTSVNGTLYVNPAGPGTKQVKPNFICYQVLPSPVNGFTHVAYFNYENPNNTTVYIPVGPKNSFSGSARDASLQPSVFLPGTSAPIAFPFMGTALTWQITSNKNNGTTGSIPANTSNVVCTSPGVRTMIVQEDTPDIRVYPNPSSGKVFVELPAGQAEGTSFEVYNAVGMRCAVQVYRPSDNLVELDLSTFGQVLFIINVIRGSRMETRRVIIE
jgi:hypothetical protein